MTSYKRMARHAWHGHATHKCEYKYKWPRLHWVCPSVVRPIDRKPLRQKVALIRSVGASGSPDQQVRCLLFSFNALQRAYNTLTHLCIWAIAIATTESEKDVSFVLEEAEKEEERHEFDLATAC